MGMHDTGRNGGNRPAGPFPGLRTARKLRLPEGPMQIDGYNEPFRYGEVDDQPTLERAVMDAHYGEIDLLPDGKS